MQVVLAKEVTLWVFMNLLMIKVFLMILANNILPKILKKPHVMISKYVKTVSGLHHQLANKEIVLLSKTLKDGMPVNMDQFLELIK